MYQSVLNAVLLMAVVSSVGIEGASVGRPTWHYSEVAHWSTQFPACGGLHQSPVNINSSAAKTLDFPPILFRHYEDLPLQQTVTNDGHSLKVEIKPASKAPYIEWGDSSGSEVQYNFVQYHFHWGSVSTQGSEHTIDSVRYPMEMHLVHYNNRFDSLRTAATEPDGLAVLGVTFVTSPDDNPALIPLLQAVREIRDYNKSPNFVSKSNLYALSSLLPTNTKRFYRYRGSLTTPTCNEAVLWTVFEEPLQVSELQLAVFRSLVGLVGPSADNFRPLQNLNRRKIGKSF